MVCTRMMTWVSRCAFARLTVIVFGLAFLASGQRAEAQDIAASQRCGDATLAVQCAGGAGPRDCAATTLRLSAPGGASRILPRPAEFSGKNDRTMAVGVACAVAKDRTAYFVVEYGQLPVSCPTCEWLAVIDQSGRALTRNDPPIVTDPSLPANYSAQPNNIAYGAFIKKSGMKPGEFAHVYCKSDSSSSVCMLQSAKLGKAR